VFSVDGLPPDIADQSCIERGLIMAQKGKLLTCSTCFHQIKETDRSCPSCGASVKGAGRSTAGRLAAAAFWAFNILMLLWLVNLPGIVPTDRETDDFSFRALPDIGAAPVISIWLFGDIVLGYAAFIYRAK
jgi:hypothetical protein